MKTGQGPAAGGATHRYYQQLLSILIFPHAIFNDSQHQLSMTLANYSSIYQVPWGSGDLAWGFGLATTIGSDQETECRNDPMLGPSQNISCRVFLCQDETSWQYEPLGDYYASQIGVGH